MATRFLSPNLDQKLSGVTGNGGGTPISPKLVDASDSTYAAGTSDGGYAWVRVGPGTPTVLAANERSRKVRIHARAQHEGADVGHVEVITLVPRNPDSTPKVNADRWQWGSGAGFREGDSQWWTKTPDAKEWTNSAFDNLQIEAIWKRSAGGQFGRLIEAKMEYDVCTQPVTSATSVTNTTTSRPTVSATYASADGFAQKRYQVKVFSPAQYNASGFSADSSTSVWDSGQVYSNQFGPVVIGTDLVAGITYRAYTRTSYDFNGGDYWSAWDFASFTIATEPPPAPILTAMIDQALQRVLLTTQGRINVLSADTADFEGSVGSWAAGSNVTLIRDTAQFRHGAASGKMTATAAADMWVQTPLGTSGYAAEAGQQWTASVYFRANTTGRSTRISIWWYNAAGGLISASDSSLVSDASGNWNANPSVTATAPAGTKYMALVVRVNAPAAGEVHWFDQPQLTPGTGQPWTPGGYLPTTTTRVDFWDMTTGGMNHARAEVAAGSTSRTTTPGYFVPTAADTLTPDPANALAGGSGILWKPSATSSRLDIGYQRGAFAPDYALPAPPGAVAVASVWAKATASGSYTASAEVADGTGTVVGSVQGTTTFLVTTAWTRHFLVFTIPPGVIFSQLGITNATGATGQSVWLDQFQWEIRAPEAGAPQDSLVTRIRAELAVFPTWLAGKQGFIGEVGWPKTTDSASWNAAAERWYDDIDAAGLWATYWATGEWWGTTYNLAAYEDAGAPAGVDTAKNPAAIIEAHPTAGGVWRGINVAGGEFNPSAVPGVYDTDYHYDGQQTFDFLASRGIEVVRLPIRWERIQRTLNGTLDSGEVTRVGALLDRVWAAGLYAFLDIHNYGRYRLSASPTVERPIGGADVSQANYTDLMTKLVGSTLWAKPAFLALLLMNEPHDMPTSYTAAVTHYTIDSTISPWTGDPGNTVTRDTVTVHDGAGSMKDVKTFAGGGFEAFRMGDNVGTLHDESANGVTYGFWAKAPSGESGWSARLDIQDAAFANIPGGTTALDPTLWTFCTSTFTTAQVASMRAKAIQIQHNSPTAGSKTCFVDTITQGTLKTGPKMWEEHAQAAVTAIRTAEGAGAHKLLGVPLEGWSAVKSAQLNHPNGPWIVDTANAHFYEGHHYFDRDNSGDYPDTYAAEVADATSRGYASGVVPDVTPALWTPGEGAAPNWQPVRNYAAVALPAGQQWADSDFEIVTNLVRVYRARTNVTLGLANLASVDTAGVFAAFWLAPDGAWRLVDIHRPERNVVLFVAGDNLDEQIRPEQVELQPAGADYAVVYSDFVGGYRSALPVLGLGEQQWSALKSYVQTDDVWLLKLPEGGGRYIRFMERTVSRSGPVDLIQRRISLAYLQVGRPPDGA